jgi:hypothetical protein
VSELGVVGDPAGMRALAAALRAQADDLGARAADVHTAVLAVTFEGPAATRLQSRAAGARFALVSQAGRLQDVAALLERAAAEVEAERAAAARRLREAQEQLVP